MVSRLVSDGDRRARFHAAAAQPRRSDPTVRCGAAEPPRPEDAPVAILLASASLRGGKTEGKKAGEEKFKRGKRKENEDESEKEPTGGAAVASACLDLRVFQTSRLASRDKQRTHAHQKCPP